MPVSDTIPYQWYDTPNIHWCMLGDFEALCAKNRLRVLERVVMNGVKRVTFMPNLRGAWPSTGWRANNNKRRAAPPRDP